MPYFIKESLLFKLWVKIIKKIIEWFDESRLKKIAYAINGCFKQSKTAHFFNAYIKRNPYFLNSEFFAFIRRIAGLIDRLLGFINRVLTPVAGSSRVVKEAAAVEKMPFNEKMGLFAVFVAAVELGFCIGSFFMGTLAQVSFAYILLPVVICIFLVVWRRLSVIFKNSFIYKCIKFLFD